MGTDGGRASEAPGLWDVSGWAPDALLRVQQLALEAAASAILITDREGRIEWANPAFFRMTGYAAAEVAGKTPSFLKSGLHDAALYRGLWDTILAGDVWRGEMTNRKKDGSLYVEEQTIAPVRATAGEISHFIAVKHDVTERRRVEATLREAKEAAEGVARAKSEFLANTSHELRTPLHAVIGLSELLLESELSHRQRAMLDTVRESGETLLALINDLLDLSKLEAGRLELHHQPVEVEALFAAAIAQVAPRAVAKGIELVWSIDPEVPAWIVADGLRVSQVFLNLLGNAVKFTDEGVVEARVSLGEPRRLPIRPGDAVRLRASVRDTGLGIPKEKRHLLFRSFSQLESSVTRRYGGTGLGLAISKTLAERMGGGIEVESSGVAGKGSRFTFEIDAVVAPPEGAAVPREPVLSGRRVAVVARNPALARTIISTLETLGADPIRVHAGAPLPGAISVVIADEPNPTEERASGPPVIALDRMGTLGERDGVTAILKPLRPSVLREALLAIVDPASKREPQTAPDAPPMPRVRVLVADDSPVGQQVVMAQLTRLGVCADVVGDGAAAIAAIASGRYDLALLDVNMPERGGLEVAREVRKLPGIASETVLVALTASAMPGDRERCIEAGMDEYLSKPVRIGTLEATLRATLEGREPRSKRLGPGPVSEAEPLSDVIDPMAIEELRGELGTPAFDEVMATFRENGRALLAAAGEAVRAVDLAALRHAVHTLKGGAAACGAPAVARIGAEVERLAAARDMEGIAIRLALLQRAFEGFLAALAASQRAP